MSGTGGVDGAQRRKSPAHEVRRSTDSADGPDGAVAALARRMGLTPGEVLEILERLPYGEQEDVAIPEVWRRPFARKALERYAARKRAVTRLAAQGEL